MSAFFTSWKTGFKSWLNTSSIHCCLSSFFSYFLSLSWQLLDTWWIDQESSCLLDSFSTPGGSIKLLFLDWWVAPRYLLDTSAIDDLFLIPPSIASLIPLDTCICWDLLAFLYKASAWSGSHFHRSFSILLCFSPKNTPISLLSWFSRILQGFSSFSSLDKLLILSHSCISCFET